MGIITPDLIAGLMLKKIEHSGTSLRARAPVDESYAAGM